MHTQTNSSVYNLETPHLSVIRHKMQCAIESAIIWPYGLFQFWVPVTRKGQRLLETCGPLTDWYIDADVAKHRRPSEDYFYSIEAQQVHEDGIRTIKGPVATAFLNHLPLFIYNLECYPLTECSYPLLALAIAYRLTRYLVLPIFDPSTKCCVGVLEGNMKDGDMKDELNDLIASIKREGLIAFDPREWQLFESIKGLRHANGEIKGAFESICDSAFEANCDSHKLCSAQAWIRYQDKNHESYLFMQNKRGLALKLVHYCNPERDRDEHWIKFCKECDIHPLRMGEGLVGKSLENHEPYLCKDISMVDMNEPSLSHTGGIKGSSFAICLRSSHTQNLDYVLEFFWTDGENVIELLESILSTLEMTLPSFKVVSGKDIGNKLQVKEITYSSEANRCVVEDIVISPQANKSSNKEHDTSQKHQGVIKPVGSRVIGNSMTLTFDDLLSMPSVESESEINAEMGLIKFTSLVESNECAMTEAIISHEADKSSNSENNTSHVHQEDIEQVGSIMIKADTNLNCESAASEEIGGESCVGSMVIGNPMTLTVDDLLCKPSVESESEIDAEMGGISSLIKFTSPLESNECALTDAIISHKADNSSNRENNTSHVHQEDNEQVGSIMIEAGTNLNCESAASEEIGSESCVGENTNSSESTHEANKISKKKHIVISHETNKISKRKRNTTRIPLSREAILQQKHSGRTQEEAATNLSVCVKTLWRKCTEFGIKWKEPNPGKSKLSEFEGEQNDTNGVDIQTTQDPLVIIKDSIPNKSALIIKAKFKGECVIIKLPSLQAIEEKISKAFKLDRGSYKLRYLDEVNDMVIIIDDEDFRDCLESFRSREITTIQLDVFSDDLLPLYL